MANLPPGMNVNYLSGLGGNDITGGYSKSEVTNTTRTRRP